MIKVFAERLFTKNFAATFSDKIGSDIIHKTAIGIN